ncbi:MAG TPA: DNA polymerase IV [Tissierellia bacterium]|nr:DNA polymerase IV [Tissierellia bacterium]
MKERIIFHVDVNSAYLSWEAVYRLQHGESIDLREIPSIVGGDESKRHGIVLSKSIPAKEYGIVTGESVYSARQKCPNLTIVPPNYERYIKASNSMISLLNEYSPIIQRFSIDEVFMDCSHFKGKDFLKIAYEIKERIKEELGFTVNIGISSNKLLAKMASDFKKPDRIHTLFPDEIKEKMWPLPVGELFMIGVKTQRKLNGRGIYTIGELANLDRKYIYSWLKMPGLLIWEYANGIENSPVRSISYPVKSIGNSTTTSYDVDNRKEAYMFLLAISEMVGMRTRDLKLCGKVVSVSIRNEEFYSYSHQRKLDVATNSTNTIYETSKKLFDEMWDGKPIRRFNITLSELSSSDFYQLSLLEGYSEKDEKLNKAIDRIRCKYGYNSIIRSCFLHSGINPIIGGVMEEEYPMMSSII